MKKKTIQRAHVQYFCTTPKHRKPGQISTNMWVSRPQPDCQGHRDGDQSLSLHITNRKPIFCFSIICVFLPHQHFQRYSHDRTIEYHDGNNTESTESLRHQWKECQVQKTFLCSQAFQVGVHVLQ